MGLGFGWLDGSSGHDQGALAGLEGTKSSTIGTGMRRGQLVGLLLREMFECSFEQTLSGGLSHFLESAKIDIVSRSLLAECLLGDDFSPRSSEVPEMAKILVGE